MAEESSPTFHTFIRCSTTPTSSPAYTDSASGQSLTLADVDRKADVLRSNLFVMGVRLGSVVGIVSPNTIQLPVVMLALSRLGALLCPLNSTFTKDELRVQLEDSGASVVIAHSTTLDLVLGADVPTVTLVYVWNTGDSKVPDGQWKSLSTPLRHVANFDELLVEGRRVPPLHEGTGADPLLLLYSSGTTGRSKGVLVRHRSITNQCGTLPAWMGLTNKDTILLGLPLYHAYMQCCALYLPFTTGCHVIIMPQLELQLALDVVDRYQVTIMYAVPPLLLRLSQLPSGVVRGKSLRAFVSAAAPVSVSCLDALKERVPCEVWNLYGSTEAGGIMTGTKNAADGTSGTILGDWQVKLVDPETGSTVEGDGAVGELWVRGETTMHSYLHHPEITKETFDSDGYMRTGDMVGLRDGNYTVRDRIKDMIKCLGQQVAPAELEDVLVSHPKVAVAAVVGAIVGGEECAQAFVQLVPGDEAPTTPSELIEYVASRVAIHKRLYGGVTLVDSIPVSAAGKILRRQVKADVGKHTASESTLRSILMATSIALNIAVDDLRPDDRWNDLGLTSVGRLQLLARIPGSGELPASIWVDYPTPSTLAQHITGLATPLPPPVEDGSTAWTLMRRILGIVRGVLPPVGKPAQRDVKALASALTLPESTIQGMLDESQTTRDFVNAVVGYMGREIAAEGGGLGEGTSIVRDDLGKDVRMSQRAMKHLQAMKYSIKRSTGELDIEERRRQLFQLVRNDYPVRYQSDLEATVSHLDGVAADGTIDGPTPGNVPRIPKLDDPPPVDCRIITPVGGPNKAVIIILFPAAAFYRASPGLHDPEGRMLAEVTGGIIVCPILPQVPESTILAGSDAAVEAARWVAASWSKLCDWPVDLIADKSPAVGVWGLSAGGNQSARVSQELRDVIQFAILAMPRMHLDPNTDSQRRYSSFLPSSDVMDFVLSHTGCELADRRVSPGTAKDLKGIPPTFVVIAELDCMRDEGLEYVEQLRSAGVTVGLYEEKGALHAYNMLPLLYPETWTLIDRLVAFINRVTTC